jgi:hypothetical protein
MVYDLNSAVQGLEFRVKVGRDSKCRARDSGCRVRVQGSGF